MREDGGKSLQNVLSVSTAANNRYLFHFSSLNSLTQWTAAIRLSMFEQTTLQEAYTGSLIAGKGKLLNNIRQVMDKSKIKYEDWARVRFGAGTPWRRCWFVVTPPDEKEVLKAQKSMKKKPSYGKAPVFRGDLKFYETKRVTKKTKPIATIKDAFSAYAIYPQSKPLIDQSTLVKIEGKITIHDAAESTTDGFVFVMPESHPAVSGFEMMLRFLFPVWDTFALYGRPNRLIADVRDQRGLMFALPRDRRYGYLELLDVSALIHADGSGSWAERDWRFKMKELTAKRMNIALENQDNDSVANKASSSRTSLPPTRNGRLRFDDSPSRRNSHNRTPEPRHRSSKDIIQGAFGVLHHRRSASDNMTSTNPRGSPLPPGRATPASQYDESPPAPPPHRDGILSNTENHDRFETASESSSKDSGEKTPERTIPPEVKALAERSPPPQPVAVPPIMSHGPSQKPTPRPQMRVRNPEMDDATLSQLEDMSQHNRYQAQPGTTQNQGNRDPRYNGAYSTYPDRSSWNAEDEHPTSMMHQHYQYPPQSKSRYPNPQGPSRLATIPASPHIDQTGPESGKTPTSYFPNEETIHEVPVRPAPPPHSHSNSSINRKPLPSTSNPASRDNSRPNTASGPEMNPVDGFGNPSPRKTPSPVKQRGEDRFLQQQPQAPRMQGLGPAFDPRRANMGEGSFGPPLGLNNQGGERTMPSYPTSNVYGPNTAMGRGNLGAPPVSNIPPQMQWQARPENQHPSNINYGVQGQSRPSPPIVGPPGPPMAGFQPPLQGPIPIRGPPSNNGPYPPQHMMPSMQPRPYDNVMMPQNQNNPNLPSQQQMLPPQQMQSPQQQMQPPQQMQPQQPYTHPRQSWV